MKHGKKGATAIFFLDWINNIQNCRNVEAVQLVVRASSPKGLNIL